ncbi:MAG: hypothetical protein PHT60_14070 [Acidiphilium sp.]|nr:hypothetical protein [Acidiphilium sp.]MDD4936892.1 hypothetical protein [Acidiphilium sp.]
MKRSTVIIGLGLCAIVYLVGHHIARQAQVPPSVTRPNIGQTVQAPNKNPVTGNPAVPGPAAQTIDQTLPSHDAQIARLEQEYRDHAGFRQLVTDYNAETGHPGRGVTASLEALDQDAVAGAPAFALFRAVQPRAEIARALDHHWRDERERRDRNTPAP